MALTECENIEVSYPADKHFEYRMFIYRVTLKLVDLFSTGCAAYFLLQGIICDSKTKNSVHYVTEKALG